MRTLNDLLNAAAARCTPSNDTGTAAAVGVSRSAVSTWRHGGVITPEHLSKLIDRAQADPAIAVTILQAQAKTREQRALWSALARRLGAAASVAAVALLTLQPSYASPEKQGVSRAAGVTAATAPAIDYANWLGAARRLLSRLSRFFRTANGSALVWA